MKKFKWPWSKEKKEVKHPPIDLSDFKDEIDPWLATARATRNARNLLDEHYKKAHKSFWAKINEIIGYDLPGNWTFNADDYTVAPTAEDGETVFTPDKPEADPELSAYEKHWQGMLATFYKDK